MGEFGLVGCSRVSPVCSIFVSTIYWLLSSRVGARLQALGWLDTGDKNFYNDCSGTYGGGHTFISRCNPIKGVQADLEEALQKANTGAPSFKCSKGNPAGCW